MSSKFFWILFILALAFSIIFYFSPYEKKEIPLKDFFKTPDVAVVKLSPDSKYISYGKRWKERVNIFIQDLKTNKIKQLTKVKTRDVFNYTWIDDNTIVYAIDHGGDENFHLFAVSIDENKEKNLTPFDKVSAEIIDPLENTPDTILIQMNKRDPRNFDAYRLNVKTGEMEMVAENPGDVSKWFADKNGKVRVAEYLNGIKAGIKYRKTEKDPWIDLYNYDFRERAFPLCFGFEEDKIFVSSNIDRDKFAIYEFDLNYPNYKKLIYENPDVDISLVQDPIFRHEENPLIISNKEKKVLGIKYQKEKMQFAIFDEKYQKIKDYLNEKLPHYINIIVSKNKEENLFVVHAFNDLTRGYYYMYDKKKNTLKKLFSITPWIDEKKMNPKTPISYSSRDGLNIHGYLTLPKNKKNNLPFVIMPHGGPWFRDIWNYEDYVQFLANRGYAILQVNFRGSTGYGRKFWEASFKQWGLKMQDDITDGVMWAIKEKIADPKKIAIWGASYGGYATLMGTIKTPDLYAAAADYVGVTDLFTFFETMPPYWDRDKPKYYIMIGNPKKDKEQFIETSPIYHIDKIKTPLFIAQGANDPRVSKIQADEMVKKLREKSIPIEYMVKENEGHGFRNEENKIDLYSAIEKFFKNHVLSRKK